MFYSTDEESERVRESDAAHTHDGVVFNKKITKGRALLISVVLTAQPADEPGMLFL